MATRTNRAVSPIVGSIALVAITAILALSLATLAVGMTDGLESPTLEADDAPDADFEASDTRHGVLVEHTGGDTLSADRVTVAGEPWGDGELSAGATTTVSERGPVVWSDGDREVTLAELE